MPTTAEKRVLFVAGDILGATRFATTDFGWDVEIATSAAEALELLQRGDMPVSAVVSEIGLRGLTTDSFLGEAGARHPSITRLAITGPRTARYVPVPSGAVMTVGRIGEPKDFVLALERGHHLQRLIGSDAVRALVGSLDRLPSAPKSYGALMELARSETSSLADIAAIIASDGAMSVKVLQLVNSSFFGSARRITSIQQAVARLGLGLLKGLVLSAHAFQSFPQQALGAFSLEELQRRSAHVAQLARRFLADHPLAEDAFAAGLLHDVGKLVLALREAARFAEACARSAATKEPLVAVEREILGAAHPEVGAHLLATWGIPFSIVESVACHRDPGDVHGPDLIVLAAVHAASAIADDAADTVDVAFLERAGFEGRLPAWKKLAEEAAREAADG